MKYLSFYIFFLVLVLTSCVTTKKVVVEDDLKNISELKLIKSISDNSIDFNNLYFKKFDADIDVPGTSISVKGSMYIVKDKEIVISIAPILGIELARAQFTNDKIVILDRTKKQVITTDYEYLSKKINSKVNFQALQSLLINQFFCYQELTTDINCVKGYDRGVSDGMYFLQNVSDHKMSRFGKKKDNRSSFFLQYSFLPETFNLSKIVLKNTISDELMTIVYSNFKSLSGIQFPYHISINGKKGKEEAKVDIIYSQIEMNSSTEIGFKIPDKYEVKNLK